MVILCNELKLLIYLIKIVRRNANELDVSVLDVNLLNVKPSIISAGKKWYLRKKCFKRGKSAGRNRYSYSKTYKKYLDVNT
ncbi:hypothetical protein RCL_jg13359.t1 [Rhizophagus clarus]|uniref:Uncharacterized protein n=1 Tax=Rhizophagus clarus TaxID=94130 RepID=A0A8H3LQX6_9GLOM|nr:hypothetical protein RCL_jg13359.t1 [Rhizophagus clarus]